MRFASTIAILAVGASTIVASPATPFYQERPDLDSTLSPGAESNSSLWLQSSMQEFPSHSTFSDPADATEEEDDYDSDDDPIEGSSKWGERQGWIYLIRHGEKVKKSDKTGLSDRGVKRAKCLTSVFGNRRARVTYPIDYILAQDFKPSGQRRRPFETVKPLAKKYGIKLNHKCDRDDTKCAVRKIKKRARAGKNVLVVWEHARLSKIAAALGIKGLVYPSERYDIIFKIKGRKVHSIVSERCEGLDEDWMEWKSEKKGKHGKSPRGGRLVDDESWADDAKEKDIDYDTQY